MNFYFKKLSCLLWIVLGTSLTTLTYATDMTYVTFDKILFGTISCRSMPEPEFNLTCGAMKEQFVRLSGWKRIDESGQDSEISEITAYVELDPIMYVHNYAIHHSDGFNECRKAILLVKSDPIKWDLRVGTESEYRRILSCEAVNYDLMKQYHAEKQI